MYLQLSAVVLWPFHSHIKPRVVHFVPGMVNVVMGGSRTGKSAVIPIIDYCFGSSSCAIPKKVIRSACSWYGVVIETNEGQKLLARKNPDGAETSQEMFILEGDKITVPNEIAESNTSVMAVKRRLDELCALSKLDFSGGGVTNSFDYRVSFRDLMAFVFQPQNVVANRDVLFYRTETQAYREKLSRNTLPYVLGAVSPTVLVAQHALEGLNRELRRKERDLERASTASSRWEAEMSGQLARARELGLVDEAAESNLAKDSMLKLLRNVAKKTVNDFKADSTTITKAVEQLVNLETDETKFADDLAKLKARQSELNRLREGAGGFREALATQRDRLEISGWLAEQPMERNGCPICGSEATLQLETLQKLRKNYAEIEATIGTLSEVPTAVDREVQHLKTGIDLTVEKLAGIRREKKVLGETSLEARNRQFQSLGVAHFLGQLDQAIRLYDEVSDDGELAKEISKLKVDIRECEKRVDRNEIERRKELAIAALSQSIAEFMPLLDNDHHLDTTRLIIEDLTLRISGADGDSFLWNIGSGSNWLSYHLSTLLALQKYFLNNLPNPVPGLLIFDQPSQVYFPEKLVRRGNAVSPDPSWTNDEDTQAVRLAFSLLGKIVGQLKGQLQIIVLDHAPLPVWGHLENVTEAANWRTGEKLVPTDWPGADE
jgi:hypothetical protein